MTFMVSWQTFGGPCANKTFTDREAMEAFIKTYQQHWKSFSRFQYKPSGTGVDEMTEIL